MPVPNSEIGLILVGIIYAAILAAVLIGLCWLEIQLLMLIVRGICWLFTRRQPVAIEPSSDSTAVVDTPPPNAKATTRQQRQEDLPPIPVDDLLSEPDADCGSPGEFCECEGAHESPASEEWRGGDGDNNNGDKRWLEPTEFELAQESVQYAPEGQFGQDGSFEETCELIETDCTLNNHPQHYEAHVGMYRRVQSKASARLRGSILNNIACCLAGEGDWRSAAEAFRQAVTTFVIGDIDPNMIHAQAMLENLTELAEFGEENAIRELKVCQAYLSRPPLSHDTKPVLAMVKANLELAQARANK
jgi:hypothetical protein